METLNKTMAMVDKTIRSVFRWALGVATAVLVAALIGAGAIAWHWVSTLHH